MKKNSFFILFLLVSVISHAQIKTKLKNPFRKDSSGRITIGSAASGLSTDDIAGGLKEALSKGVESSTGLLSAPDGFFANAAVKILLPPEAQKVEKNLRNAGLGKQVDQAVLTMNRAAEDAAKSAAPIFLDAIRRITISDALNILRGNDSAATTYLKANTTSALSAAFRPTIDSSLAKVDATKYWNTITTSYNQLPFVKKLETDLTTYVTGKALDGLFHEIGLKEKDIREHPAARTTDLLKKVFSQQ